MKIPRKAVVSKRPSVEQIQDSKRWDYFIKASSLPYEQLSEEWLDFFSAQSDPQSASTELVRLIDLAILRDEKK